jgi:hypothetical protein
MPAEASRWPSSETLHNSRQSVLPAFYDAGCQRALLIRSSGAQDTTAMRKNIRRLALLALAYIAFWPVEYSVAQDQPRARELNRSGPVRVYRKRESPVLFSQEGEVRFQKAYVDQNGSIRADGHNLDLYGAVLIRRDRICTSAEGARWTCGQRAYKQILWGERRGHSTFGAVQRLPKELPHVATLSF